MFVMVRAVSLAIIQHHPFRRNLIHFPEPPARGDGLGRGSQAGVLVLSSCKSPYTKALGKDGILVCHGRAVMH